MSQSTTHARRLPLVAAISLLLGHAGCSPVLPVGLTNLSPDAATANGAGGDMVKGAGGASAALGGATGSGGLPDGAGGRIGIDGGAGSGIGGFDAGVDGGQGGARPTGPPPRPASFVAALEVTSRQDAVAAVMGDFDNDGKIDLAVANATGLAVSVLLGKGAAAFTAPVDYAAGMSPSAIAAGDVNGDGALDLIVANHDDGTMTVLLNDRHGVFGAPTIYATGANPVAIAIGDLNRDGRQDVVVAVAAMSTDPATPFAAAGYLSVFLNNGAGRFAPPVIYLSGTGPTAVAIADLNHDGLSDLAIATSQQTPLTGDESNVTVLINKGNATFATPVAYGVQPQPTSVVAGDLDGDNVPDLVVAGAQGTVMFNKGDGTFPVNDTFSFQNITGSPTPLGVALADINGDGRLDLAIAGQEGTVSVALNGGGKNAFGVPLIYSIGSYATAVAFGDLNADGKADLAVVENNVSVLLGTGQGTFAVAPSYAVSASPAGLAVGDLNGDAKLDLAVADGDGHVSVLMNTGRGAFAAAVNYDGAAYPTSIVSADLNGDGRLDLAVTNDMTADVSVFLNRGGGLFAPQVKSPASLGANAMAAADFDGDGRLDLAVTSSTGGATAGAPRTATLSILLNRGGGVFAAPVNYSVGEETYAIAVGDLNGDGKIDVVVNANPSTPGTAGVSVLLNKGDGTLAGPVHYVIGSGVDSGHFVIGDLDGDGKPDLAVSDFDGGNLVVLVNDGTGRFQLSGTYPAEWEIDAIALGDLNGDGTPDLAVASVNGGAVHLFLNYGDGTFFEGTDYTVGSNPFSVVIGDFDGDHKPDLAVSILSGQVTVLTNNSPN